MGEKSDDVRRRTGEGREAWGAYWASDQTIVLLYPNALNHCE